MEEQSSEGQSSEGERQSEDEQLAGDAEQKQAGPTGPGTHTFQNELAEGQLGIQQLSRSSERFKNIALGHGPDPSGTQARHANPPVHYPLLRHQHIVLKYFRH